MAKLVRNVGRALWIALPLLAIVVFLVLPQRRVLAATYTNPLWTNPSAGCSCDSSCCERPPLRSPEGVNYIDGTLQVTFPILTNPGAVEQHALSVTWDSSISGMTQMGKGMLPSWLITAEYVVDIPQNPTANGGHHALIRRANGLIDRWDWNGSAYVAVSCSATDALTTSSGNYVLTDKHGNIVHFTSSGMPDDFTDRNGNVFDQTYSTYVQTAMADTRGHTYTVTRTND